MKKILIALALCLVIVGLTAAPAFAETQTASLYGFHYTPVPGSARFITNQGDSALVVCLNFTNRLPKTKYAVYLRIEDSTDRWIGYLTTDRSGNWGLRGDQDQFEVALTAGEYDVSLQLIPLNKDRTFMIGQYWFYSEWVTVIIPNS